MGNLEVTTRYIKLHLTKFWLKKFGLLINKNRMFKLKSSISPLFETGAMCRLNSP